MKEHAYVHTVQAVNKGQTERERKKRVCVEKKVLFSGEKLWFFLMIVILFLFMVAGLGS